MAPKSKSSSGPILKQGTLSFASAKRGSTAASKANALKTSPSVSSVKPHGGEKREPSSRTASISSTVNASSTGSSTEDDDVLIKSTAEQRSSKRRKTANGQAQGIPKAAGVVRKAAANDSDTSSAEEPEEQVDLKVLEKNPRIQRLYNQTRARMGDVSPVHAARQTKIHHILRVFDTSYEYGPCTGMTRLQRWERAHVLGLNPPPEVREILLSKQGLEEDEYRQCVFYDDV
ncbi:hypothetical protein ACEPAG_4094 [Sanghuangporus baumii]